MPFFDARWPPKGRRQIIQKYFDSNPPFILIEKFSGADQCLSFAREWQGSTNLLLMRIIVSMRSEIVEQPQRPSLAQGP
jgi:hypothetical protein